MVAEVANAARREAIERIFTGVKINIEDESGRITLT